MRSRGAAGRHLQGRRRFVAGGVGWALVVAALFAGGWFLAGPDAGPAFGQPPETNPSGEASAAADAERVEGEDDDTTVREKTIYVPYTKLRRVFEKDGRGVFLPYDQFQQLWTAARKQLVPEVQQSPPVKAFITEIESVATVGADVVTVEATVSLEVLTDGWHEVPLRLADSAILQAILDGEPARIVHRPPLGYVLLLRKEAGDAQQRVLRLRYAKAIQKSPGQNQVAFQAPQAPVNRWELRIPEPGVKVNIFPMIAASTIDPSDEASEPEASEPEAEKTKPGDETEETKPGDETEETKPGDATGLTRVQAFVGAAPTIRFDWTPKSEGASGLDALVDVQARQRVEIGEGVIRTTARLTYEISRAEIGRLQVDLPADHKLTGVFDPNVRQWEVASAEGRQRVTVQLFEPAQGSQELALELEKFSNDVSGAAVEIPVIRALDVARQQGIVVVNVSPALRAEVLRQDGLLQLDAAELPAGVAESNPQFAYRYATLPFDLALQVDKVEPRISTRELVEAYLEPRQLTVELLALFTVERAGVFQLRFDVPAEYQVLSVTGQAAAGAQPVLVDDFHRAGPDGARLEVNLSRKALGKVGLRLALRKTLDDPNLITPTGEAATISINPPRVSPGSAEQPGQLDQVDATFILYAPESLQVTPSSETALRAIPFEESLRDTQTLRGGRFSDLRPLLAYARSREAAELQVAVERRKPYVTARQLLRAKIESGVVQYQADFFYNIRYSSLPALRIDLPADLAAKIRNTTRGVRETVMDPAPEDLAEGYVAWKLSRDTELLGDVQLTLTWEEAMDELDVGASIVVELPRLMPREADRAWGQIVLEKAENLDLRPAGELEGLRPIDPQTDLMQGADGSNVARAFEFHDAWSLGVRITRYQLEEVKRTSIERGLVRTVVTRRVPGRPRQTLVQALFRVRSVRQRMAIELPEGVEFDANPLRINGQAVQLERGDQDEFFIPLADRDLDEPFLLEIRYAAPGSYRNLEIPSFPADPAIQKVYLCAYLPDELAVVGSDGPWTSETILQLREMLAGIPAVRHSDEQLLEWVREGFDTSGSPEFATDGNLYVYSTLRPPPGGSLELAVIRRMLLNGLILITIVGLGIVLLARPLGERLIFLVAILACLIASAVFFPTLAVQLLNLVLLASVVLVVALWLAVWLLRAIPRLAQGMRRAPAFSGAGAGQVAASEIPTAEAVSDDRGPNAADASETPADPGPGDSPFASPDNDPKPGDPKPGDPKRSSGSDGGDRPDPSDSEEQEGGSSHV